MTPFEDLNDQIVYTNVKSQDDAVKLKDDALKAVATGKTVVIFFENRYHLHLAPGWDPYQVRKEIDAWMNQTDKSPVVNASTDTTTTPIPKTKTKSSRSKLKS